MHHLGTFEAVLSKYPEFSRPSNVATTPAYASHIDDHASKELPGYRECFVLVNEDNGEVVKEFDKKILRYGNAATRKIRRNPRRANG